MRTVLRAFFVLVFLAIAVGALGSWYVLNEFDAPGPAAAGGTPETIVSIPMGTGLNQTAAILERQGVVSNGLIFRIGVMVNRKSAALKAGEYAIPSGASPSLRTCSTAASKHLQGPARYRFASRGYGESQQRAGSRFIWLHRRSWQGRRLVCRGLSASSECLDHRSRSV